MFIDNTSGNLEIEYHMIDRKEEELSRVGNLGAKGNSKTYEVNSNNMILQAQVFIIVLYVRVTPPP